MTNRDRVQADFTKLPIELGTYEFWYNGGIYYTKPHSYTGLGQDQVTTKFDRCIDETHPGPPYKTGGPLDVRHYSTDWYTVTQHELPCTNPNYGDAYKGGFMGATPPSAYLDWTDVNSPLLDDGMWCNPDWLANGVTGWANALPAQPAVDLGVALAEAREIPQMLAQTAKSFAKSWARAGGKRGPLGPRDLADDWLNANFGWRPFLNDLGNAITAVIDNEALVQQLRRDNSKWVYRRRSVRNESETEQMYEAKNSPGHMPTLTTRLYSSPLGHIRIERRTSLNVWFVGRFKYYIPYLKTSGLPSTKEALKVLGLNLSPSTLYELMPWSWLIDWYSNYGANVKIISDYCTNNTVAKYAYVMSHKKQQVAAEYYTNFKNKPLSTMAYATCEQKLRMPASPLGFGLKSSGFTSYQWSILSALGISKNKTLALTG